MARIYNAKEYAENLFGTKLDENTPADLRRDMVSVMQAYASFSLVIEVEALWETLADGIAVNVCGIDDETYELTQAIQRLDQSVHEVAKGL